MNKLITIKLNQSLEDFIKENVYRTVPDWPKLPIMVTESDGDSDIGLHLRSNLLFDLFKAFD